MRTGPFAQALPRHFSFTRLMLLVGMVGVSLTVLGGCKRMAPLDTHPLDQAGMWYESIQQLRTMNVNQAEIAQLAVARDAGISDAGCVKLVEMARGRKQTFGDGDAIAGLRNAGMPEPTILELDRLNQLSSWSGEALALHLLGMSDQIVLTLANRRANGLSTLSGDSLGKLKASGLNEAQLLELINRGTSDAEAQNIVAARQKMNSPTGFVHYGRKHR